MTLSLVEGDSLGLLDVGWASAIGRDPAVHLCASLDGLCSVHAVRVYLYTLRDCVVSPAVESEDDGAGVMRLAANVLE